MEKIQLRLRSSLQVPHSYREKLIFDHNVNGHHVAGWSDSLVSQTVKGIKNSQNSPEDGKDPLDLNKLEKIYRKVDHKSSMGLLSQ